MRGHRAEFLRMVERLTRSPNHPLHIPKRQIEVPQSLWERLHFAQTGEVKGYWEAMKDLKDRFSVIEKFFTPETVFDLRNRYWCFWQLTHLSNQWLKEAQETRKLSVDQKLDLLGVSNSLSRLAYKIVLFLDRLFFKHLSQEKYPLKDVVLSFESLRDITKKESVQTGACEVEGKSYQVRARGWFDNAEEGKFINQTQIYLTQNPDVDIMAHGYHGVLNGLAIYSRWQLPSSKEKPSEADAKELWDADKDRVTKVRDIYVLLNLHGWTEEEEGSNRLLDLKVIQIAAEILYRSADVPMVQFNASHSDGAVLSACCPGQWEDILNAVLEHRKQHKTLFPPARDYTNIGFKLKRTSILDRSAQVHAHETKSWRSMIQEKSILYGRGPVVPHYWSSPPACLEGQEQMPRLEE